VISDGFGWLPRLERVDRSVYAITGTRIDSAELAAATKFLSVTHETA
jgi:hypothetical protein